MIYGDVCDGDGFRALTTGLLMLAVSAVVHAQPANPAATGPTPEARAIEAEASAHFKSRKDMISYAIGVTTARNLSKDGVEIDPALVLKGMQDTQAGGRVLMNEREIRAVMSGLVGEMRQKMAANRKEAEDINRRKGEEFRRQYAGTEGVLSLPGGVLYKVIKAGNGPKPKDADSVLVNYRGTLISGYEFDGTKAGKPATLKVSQLIVGWREALKEMPAGSRWSVVIPSNLAYGARGVGTDIGPNETLIFDIELLSIQ